MDEMKKKAKIKMLRELKKAMKDDDASELMSPFKEKMEKVTVMAPDKKGLKKGLSMAEKIMEKYSMDKEMEEDEGEEYADGGFDGDMDLDKMDLEEEEIDQSKDLKKKKK